MNFVFFGDDFVSLDLMVRPLVAIFMFTTILMMHLREKLVLGVTTKAKNKG